ncbi:hypothetical protein LN042_02640 [Kitasatospora sp. RB6PN24]|uniref:hypothetical protein n=1 Tax=Kitasatospora humi TaxID=2893891 RepID=UPI001E331B87|nr:hypothetical protein [Kitasatospora humi]MCC9306015.1 hypothetical protein [Kitasatospora humi]
MEEIPQGGAGGAPLHDTDEKHLLHPPGHDRQERGTDTGRTDADEQGNATTAEPSRARRLDPDEVAPEEDGPVTES